MKPFRFYQLMKQYHNDETFEVEKILAFGEERNIKKYLIKWKLYKVPTWEPESNIHCPELIAEFWMQEHENLSENNETISRKRSSDTSESQDPTYAPHKRSRLCPPSTSQSTMEYNKTRRHRMKTRSMQMKEAY